MRSWGFRRLGLCPTSCVEPSYVQSFRRMLRRWFIVQLQKRYVNYETHFPAWGWADNASVHPFKRSGASFYQKCFLKHLLWNRFLWVWILLHTQVSSDGSSDGSYVTAACALRLSRASCYPVESVSLCFFIVLSVSSFPLQLNFITLNISSVSSSTLTCAGVSAAGTLNTISIQVVLIYPSYLLSSGTVTHTTKQNLFANFGWRMHTEKPFFSSSFSLFLTSAPRHLLLPSCSSYAEFRLTATEGDEQ